jgi:2-polyprenyl-3-methyl-5-hydroxy-6-metoxy-1,4-benzoquinol methylase
MGTAEPELKRDSLHRLSGSLTFQILPTGKLAVSTSLSRTPFELDPSALPILLGFARDASPDRVYEQLSAEWDLPREDFDGLLRLLIARNVVTAADAAQASFAPATGGFASLTRHHVMLRDIHRVMAYKAAIERNVAGKTVVEVGCGSGILSIFAARAGARRVYAIEESAIADLAAHMFDANGVADRVELIRANSKDVSVPEQADVIIHEIFGTDPLAENLLPVIQDARDRFLKPGGRLLPFRIDVGCVGFEVKNEPVPTRELVLKQAEELAGLYGVNFTPFLHALRKAEPREFAPFLPPTQEATFDRNLLTEETPLLQMDLRGPELTVPERRCEMAVTQAGLLGGVALFFRAHLDETTILSTSPYLPRTHWGFGERALSTRIQVTPGMRVPIRLTLTQSAFTQRLSVDLE